MLSEEERKIRHNAASMRYYHRNKEKVLSYQEQYRQKNIDRVRARDRAYRKEHYKLNRDRILKFHANKRVKNNIKTAKVSNIKSISSIVLALNTIAKARL